LGGHPPQDYFNQLCLELHEGFWCIHLC
jgi:hypothetical protein